MRKMFLLSAVAAMFLSACSLKSLDHIMYGSDSRDALTDLAMSERTKTEQVETNQVEITSNESENESMNNLNDLKFNDSKLQQVFSVEVGSTSAFGPNLNEVVTSYTDEMNARGYKLTALHSMSLSNNHSRHLVTMVFDKINQ